MRSIRGLQNFLAIPIMNPLAGFMIMASVVAHAISVKLHYCNNWPAGIHIAVMYTYACMCLMLIQTKE